MSESSIEVQAQNGTPAIPAEPGSPTQEPTMSGESSSSPGAPSGAPASSTTEDTMSTDSSTPPDASHGPLTDSANPDAEAAASKSEKATSDPPKQDEKPGDAAPKKKRKRFCSERLEKRVRDSQEKSKGNTNPLVQSDRRIVSLKTTALRNASTAVALLQGKAKRADGELDKAERKLRPTLYTLQWALRNTDGGVKYVQDRQAPTAVETAERILETLPGSGFEVASVLVDALRTAVPPARKALDAKVKADGARDTAEKTYLAAVDEVAAALMSLNGALKRAKASPRLKPVPGAKGKKRKS